MRVVALLSVLAAQGLPDEPVWLDPSVPNKTIQWKFERMDRQSELCRVLLERYLQPYDEWLNHKGPEIEDLRPEREHWYLLKIRCSNPHRGSDLWIKFRLGLDELLLLEDQGEGGQAQEEILPYAIRKRSQILRVLERHFMELMGDEDAKATMIDGVAHLYRLIDKDSPPDKVRKEDLIF